MQDRSRAGGSRMENRYRSYLIGPARVGLGQFPRDLERLFERLAIDDIKAEQLFLGFRERSVNDEGRFLAFSKRRRGRGRHQTSHRPKLACLGHPVVHDLEPGHAGVVLLLGPGADDVFGMVAKYGVLHVASPLRLSRTNGGNWNPTSRERKKSRGYARLPPQLALYGPWSVHLSPLASFGQAVDLSQLASFCRDAAVPIGF